MANRIEAHSIKEAWAKASSIIKFPYDKDEASSERAGYPIFRCRGDDKYYYYICDLGDRLEVNMGNDAINVWIVEKPQMETVSFHVRREDDSFAKTYDLGTFSDNWQCFVGSDFKPFHECLAFMTEHIVTKMIMSRDGYAVEINMTFKKGQK